MNKALWKNGPVADSASERTTKRSKPLDWRRRMSDNVAFALLIYTGLQIFVTVHALKEGASSLLPYFALILLVAAIIPACRAFERRWLHLDDADASDPALRTAFRRDCIMLWALAIGLPFLLTGMIKALFAFG